MSRLSYFCKRLIKMDWAAMWQTTDLLKERSGKSRPWLMCDMLHCAVKYNAGYVDYKIAQMYRLNDKQRATVITRGISNSIVRRMNDKAYWHYFDDKTQFNELFREYIPRKWLLINESTDPDSLERLTEVHTQLIGKPLEAKVVITASEAGKEFLDSCGQDLAKLCIVSAVEVQSGEGEGDAYEALGGVKIAVSRMEGEKCARCWIYDPTVGSNAEHPCLCARCASVLTR